MSPEQARAVLDNTIAKLEEHFDAVQILVTWPMETGYTDGTHYMARGGGNWYARRGMVEAFINDDKAANIGRAVADNQASEE